MCATIPFLLSLSVLPFCKDNKKPLEGLLSSLLWSNHKHQVCKELVVQRPCHGALGIPHLLSHQQTSYLALIFRVLGEDSIFSGTERHRKLRNQRVSIPQPVDLSRPRRLIYRELMRGVVKDPLCGRLNLSAIFLVLGACNGLSQQQ